MPTLQTNETNLRENVEGVSRRVRVSRGGRGQSERRVDGRKDSVHADVSLLRERRRKDRGGSARTRRGQTTEDTDERSGIK